MTVTTSDDEKNLRLIALAEGLQPRWLEVAYESLSPVEQTFRLVWEVESEVNNGGFHLYFHNSSGEGAPLAAGALGSIGALAAADIVSRAVAAIGDVRWRDDEARRQHLTSLPEETLDALDGLDQEFFGYPDNLTALLYAYAAEHRRELGAPAEF